MTNRTFIFRKLWPGLLMVSFVLTLATFSLAAEPPASPDAVKAVLPDSTILNNKVVYVDFWASWCVPCRQSFPWMQKLYDKYHDRGFEIVAVNVDNDPRSAYKFLDENKASFDIVFDSAGTLAGLYGLEAMPSSFIYDRDGNLFTQHQGFRIQDTDSIAYIIEELLSRDVSK